MINLVFFLTGLSVLGMVLRHLWVCDAPPAARAAMQLPESGSRLGFGAGVGSDFASGSAYGSGFGSGSDSGVGAAGGFGLYRTNCPTGPAFRAAHRNSRLHGAGTVGSRSADGRDERRIWPEAVCPSGVLTGFFDIPDTGVSGRPAGPQILDAAAFEPAANPAGGVSAGDLLKKSRPAAGTADAVISEGDRSAAGAPAAAEPVSNRCAAPPADDSRWFFTAA